VPAHAERFVVAERVIADVDGLTLHVRSSWGDGELASPLLGRFNAANLLAVLAVLLESGVPIAEALGRLARLRTVAGRMERLGGGPRPLVVVDYAHTPDALTQVLAALREHCRGRLHCVFGCGGERDAGKRPLMGEVAETLADRVIVTDDNPRHEDGDRIVAQILAGLREPARATVERNRARAIAAAIAAATPGDVVLVAGKGHEDYQQVGDLRLPFSDVALVRDLLETGVAP
jgi:UDP-N-acetylmuramoyl-L-alanyl-D-glutamate--2,6-diaminopimelate ligase